MNSMRLLILLAFILYEMQCAESIKPLKLLKTLIEKHFQPQPATEHEILEQELPILGKGYHLITSHETMEGGGTIVEFNNKLYMADNGPILTDTENGEVQKEDAETNSEHATSNPEGDGEKETYEKDPNTEWLLAEPPIEKQPETDQEEKKEDTPSIKDIICNKLKSIIINKMKPVTEPTVLTSSFNCEDCTKYTTTLSTTAIPVTNSETITSVKTTIAIPPSTEKPQKICIPDDHGNVNVECQPPFVNIPPYPYPYPYPPYQPWSNNCHLPSNQQSFDCQPNVRYILYPVYMSTYGTKPQPFNNVPYSGGVPNYQRVIDYGVLKETPNYQPSSPVNAGQLFNYNNYDNRPKSHAVYQSYPVSSFIPQTPVPAAAEVPSNNLVFPNIRYPTHTMAPIVVKPYPADNVASSALPVEHRDPINVEVDSLNRFSGPVPMPNNGQDYPYRGDIRINDLGLMNMYERQLEGNPSKERRQIVHDHEKMPLAPSKIPLVDPLTKFGTLDAKSNISNVNVMEEKTSDVKLL